MDISNLSKAILNSLGAFLSSFHLSDDWNDDACFNDPNASLYKCKFNLFN